MICISNGILPDLGGLDENKPQEKDQQALFTFSYDNTLEEIDGAMKCFQKRYKSKNYILSVLAYSLITCGVIAAVILNPTSFFVYIGLMVSVMGLVYSITDRKRARMKTIEALKDLNPEDYRASFFDDRIEIETIIKPKENEVHVKIDEEADEEIITPLKTTFTPGDDLLEFLENEESLLLVFNRQQIYCFPKRCLSVDQESSLRDYLTNRLSGEQTKPQ